MSKPALGFGRAEREGEDKDAINRMFMPEFRNRLDAIIGFDQLTPEVVTHVVNKFIFKLEAQLADRHIHIELTESARAWLATKGYDKSNGARPLARLIAEKIKKPLADEVLFGKLAKGGTVRIDLKEGELTFAFEKPATPRKTHDEDSEELV